MQEGAMKAGVIFTGTGPILILTTHESLTDPLLVDKLAAKGVWKYMAYELPLDAVRKMYGAQYDKVVSDLREKDDMRVLDFNGHSVYMNFSFHDMSNMVYHEAEYKMHLEV